MTYRLASVAILAGLIGLTASGCHDNRDSWQVPAAPRGVRSVTGDGRVTITWLANTESDIRGYNVYWSPASGGGQGPYKRMGFTHDTFWVDTDVQNGVTYYYAVTAVNDAGMESELSADNVHDTPRPEGYDLRLYNAAYDSLDGAARDSSGLRFDTHTVQTGWRDPGADVFYKGAAGDRGLYTEDTTTYIVDMGPATSLQDVDYAPATGWSTGTVMLVAGHAYVIHTRDDYYASMYVREVQDRWLLLDWAFQTDQGNRELKGTAPGARGAGRVAAQVRRTP
ncbi:MAG TPA: fibronectin type III domain-containing protein [Candidatus Saccharimonadales bacterium]|nr:fibronectin type III domain-containing protein [Candidatus Saccharimonadales bacterium]